MERELEIKRQKDVLERTREVREAEKRALEAQVPTGQAVSKFSHTESVASLLRMEARLSGSRHYPLEVEAEARLLRRHEPRAASTGIMELRPPGPERQEIDKSSETVGEKEPGGAQRPSWESPPGAPERHLVPAPVLQELDDHIARWVAERDSRIQGRELSERDLRILKGDAGEGRTYVDLLGRHESERILHQPRFEDSDRVRTPDFAVLSEQNQDRLVEIVDSKAWSLLRPREVQGKLLSDEEFFRYLQERPSPHTLVNTAELRMVVEKYTSSPRLEPDGKMVLYFPEEVTRFAPQVTHALEGWSGTDIAHGRTVEVRSMGVWHEDLWEDVRRRLT